MFVEPKPEAKDELDRSPEKPVQSHWRVADMSARGGRIGVKEGDCYLPPEVLLLPPKPKPVDWLLLLLPKPPPPKPKDMMGVCEASRARYGLVD